MAPLGAPIFFAHFVTISHHFPYFFEMYKRIESFQLENVFEIKGSRGMRIQEFPRVHFENVFKNIKGSRVFMICRELENVFKSITDSWRSEFQGFF